MTRKAELAQSGPSEPTHGRTCGVALCSAWWCITKPSTGEKSCPNALEKMSGDDDQQEQTIADDLVVTKYKMGADIANRKCGLAR